MTKAQKDRYERYIQAFKVQDVPLVESLVQTLACLEIEEEALQAVVDKLGTTYETPSGQRKQNPEWQQLKEDRARKAQIIGKIHALIASDVQQSDPLGELMDELD